MRSSVPWPPLLLRARTAKCRTPCARSWAKLAERPGVSRLVLVPAPEHSGIAARMRQPTKDAHRQWLAQANEPIEQLQAEVAELRAGGNTTTRQG